ncbi:MAG: alpha/beta hydrolase [Rickettsiaceae bacterium]|jgi:pimeloyl-ACP methyl ester carboxylesterase|nr:alpha/beta hydrolase [Rickettsiaceae bacterium]
MTRELFINIPGQNRKLAYLEWGDATNPKVLFCVHGLSRNSHDFDYLAKALSGEYRVIAVDIAGRGRSDWLSNKLLYNYHTYVSDVLILLNTLGITKVDWVGTSMGGIIAMMVARAEPTLINKLVLNDIGSFVPGAALDRIFTYVGKTPLFDTRAEAESAIRARMGTFGIKNEEHWNQITWHSVETFGDKFRFAYDPEIIKKPSVPIRILANIKHPSKWLKTPDVDLTIFWNAVRCPVLVLRGELSDILLPGTVEKMKVSNPQVAVIELPGVGHAPMLMEERQITLVKEWLL